MTFEEGKIAPEWSKAIYLSANGLSNRRRDTDSLTKDESVEPIDRHKGFITRVRL